MNTITISTVCKPLLHNTGETVCQGRPYTKEQLRSCVPGSTTTIHKEDIEVKAQSLGKHIRN